MLEQHWLFVISGAILGAFILRMIVRERITLQSSLAFMALLVGLVTLAAFPGALKSLASLMGFDLPSNFLFAAGLCALTLIHVGTMAALSKLELRSVALTQELGLLRELVVRQAETLARQTGSPPPPDSRSPSP